MIGKSQMLEGLAIKAILGGIKGWFFDVLSWVARHPWQSLCLALGAWLAWLLLFTIPSLEGARDAEIAAHQKTKADYREAQRLAAIAAIEQRKRYEAMFAQLAEDSENAEQQARSDAMAIANGYIAVNRVRCEAGTNLDGSASGAGAIAGNSDTGVLEGDSQAPELVAVTATDVRICTANTIKLEQAREWALGLNTE